MNKSVMEETLALTACATRVAVLIPGAANGCVFLVYD